MSTTFHTHVRELMDAALEQRTTRRVAFVRAAAGDDTALLREVESLLPHYSECSGFEIELPRLRGGLFDGAFPRTSFDIEQRKPPFAIGYYKVVQEVGRGGMGIVYRAACPKRNYDVAIKLMQACPLGSGERYLSFKCEEELLRHLRHPGIVRFLHSGFLDDRGPNDSLSRRPYFVMEFVRGKPITRFVTERNLNALQRLDLLVRVCDAVEYAHHHGIVHSDLKPDNILVDESGAPRILDFGIARIQEFGSSRSEQSGVFQGTYAYASPEQRECRLDSLCPASDVYSLALVAHEVLAGALPRIQRGRILVDLRPVVLPDPADPVHNREFQYALRTILGTALRCSPGPGYPTAGPFGADFSELRKAFVPRSFWQRFLDFRDRSNVQNPAISTTTRLLSTLMRRRVNSGVVEASRALKK